MEISMTTSILFNCTVFPVYERTIDYTNSRVTGALAGVVVTPFVFCSEVGKIRQQTNQLILQTFKSRGRVSTFARRRLRCPHILECINMPEMIWNLIPLLQVH